MRVRLRDILLALVFGFGFPGLLVQAGEVEGKYPDAAFRAKLIPDYDFVVKATKGQIPEGCSATMFFALDRAQLKMHAEFALLQRRNVKGCSNLGQIPPLTFLKLNKFSQDDCGRLTFYARLDSIRSQLKFTDYRTSICSEDNKTQIVIEERPVDEGLSPIRDALPVIWIGAPLDGPGGGSGGHG